MVTKPMNLFRRAGWLAEAKCCRCGTLIEVGEERIAVGVFDLSYHDDEWGPTFAPEMGAISNWCCECAGTTQEFRVPNPWPRPSAKSRSESRESEQALSAATGSELTREVAAGDMQRFNQTFPTHPSPDDAMARSRSANKMAKRWAEREQDQGSNSDDNASELEELILSRGGPPQAISGVESQKNKLARFLGTPASRKLRPTIRTAAKLWVDGKSQQEIGTKLGVDQSGVSRMLKDASKKADSLH